VTVDDFVYVRLFSADDGTSRLEDIGTRLESRDFAPPAAPHLKGETSAWIGRSGPEEL
jgi:hypothetical protein